MEVIVVVMVVEEIVLVMVVVVIGKSHFWTNYLGLEVFIS